MADVVKYHSSCA